MNPPDRAFDDGAEHLSMLPYEVTFASEVGAPAAAFATATAAFAADPKVEPVKVNAVAYFEFNKTTIRAKDEPALLAEVGKMQNVTWQSVTATGHTDSVGSLNAEAAGPHKRSAAEPVAERRIRKPFYRCTSPRFARWLARNASSFS